MWYFSWVLGVGLAVTFGVLNAMWFEMTAGAVADQFSAAVSAGSVTANTEPPG